LVAVVSKAEGCAQGRLVRVATRVSGCSIRRPPEEQEGFGTHPDSLDAAHDGLTVEGVQRLNTLR